MGIKRSHKKRLTWAFGSILLVFIVIGTQQNCAPVGFNGNLTQGPAGNSGAHGDSTPVPPKDCSFNGQTVKDGDSVTAWRDSSVPYGQTCVDEVRVCHDGVLSGSYNYPSCKVGGPADCLFNGHTVPHGQKVKAYLASNVPYGKTCTGEDRVCNNGTLSGSYQYESCNVGGPASCMFNGRQIPHGDSVTAWLTSNVPYGKTCTDEKRVCNNGTLSGSYQYSSCNVGAPASCMFNGRQIAHGESVTAWLTSTVPYGQECSDQRRVCNNGTLSGTYQYASCNVGAPKSCMFNGHTIPHGGGVTAYFDDLVPYGQNCSSQYRSCNNGSLSGTYQYPACTVAPPSSCTFKFYEEKYNCYPGGEDGEFCDKYYELTNKTVPHGGSLVAYAHPEQYGYCSGENRVCSNGIMSGSYLYPKCVVQDKPGSPLMIEMNSDPNHFEPLDFSSQLKGILFDILGWNSTPVPFSKKQISWYESKEYFFLTLPDEGGQVKGIDQLFGDNTKGPDGKFAADGYKALAKYDGKSADGKTNLRPPNGFINKDDAVWSKLRMWNDANRDGIAQLNELYTLDEKGLVLIDLNADPNFKEEDQYGNITALKSVVKTTSGKYHLIFDIWFKFLNAPPTANSGGKVVLPAEKRDLR